MNADGSLSDNREWRCTRSESPARRAPGRRVERRVRRLRRSVRRRDSLGHSEVCRPEGRNHGCKTYVADLRHSQRVTEQERTERAKHRVTDDRGVTGIAVMLVPTLRDAPPLERVRWALTAFACLVAPGMTSWLTWKRLSRYIPFVPREAKRVLWSAATAFIVIGFSAFLLVISAAD
jgi:hypothetical protein